jgi:hypothetical protein
MPGRIRLAAEVRGQQPDRAAIQPGVHPVATEFDFMEPFRPFRRLVDQSGELRFNPNRQRRRLGASPFRERSRHAGIKARLQVRVLNRFIMVGFCRRVTKADLF